MQAAAGTDRPLLREDLLAEQVEEHGTTFIDVMAPDGGGVFRFYEVEFSLACAMDGERDIAGLVRWAEVELGVSPAVHEVRAVIDQLGALGYLDLSGAARAAATDLADAADSGVVMDSSDDADAKTGVAHPLELEPVTPAASAVSSAEVSLDLADHIAVGKADVQEAVRQSKVMQAVEIPKDLLDELGPSTPASTPAPVAPPPAAIEPKAPAASARVATPAPAPKAVEAAPPAPAPKVAESGPRVAPAAPAPKAVEAAPAPKAVEPAAPAPKAAEAAPKAAEAAPTPAAPAPKAAEPAAKPAAAKPAVSLPPAPEKVPEKQPVVPPAPASRTSPVLIVLLILIVLGAGAFAVWKFVLDKSNGDAATGATGATTGATGSAVEQPPQPEQPKRPPEVTAKIELAATAPQPVAAPAAGVVEWIEASGKDAKAKDVIAKLRGAKALEAQIAVLAKDVDKRTADLKAAQDAVTAATDAGSAATPKQTAAVAALEKAANDRTAALTKKTEQLEPLLVRLPVDGTLTLKSKVGERLAANAELGTVQPSPDPVATFTIPEGTKLELAAGAEVKLRIGEHPLTCTVAELAASTVRVTCPKDPVATDGAAVTWQLP